MFTLIKGGELYAPEKMGTKDILIVGRTIARIADRIDLSAILMPGSFQPPGSSLHLD